MSVLFCSYESLIFIDQSEIRLFLCNSASNVWKIFGEVKKEDDSSAGYAVCDCEALYNFHSHKTRLQVGLWHVKENVVYFRFVKWKLKMLH